MSAHRFHQRIGDDVDVILFDDCLGCERHTKNLGLSLDQSNWQEMWDRMVEVEMGDAIHYLSDNEAKLGKQMYYMYVALERHTTINPRTLFANWSL